MKKLFSGRAGRIEFSIYLFVELIAEVVVYYLDSHKSLNDKTILYLFYTCGILLLTFIPIQAVTTRRLRDLNINGGWIVINLIPILKVPFKVYLLIAKHRN